MTRKKLSEYETYQWKPSSGRLEITSDENDYSAGIYRHWLGLAAVFRTGNATSINVVHNGTSYFRRWDRALPDRTISRLCREFLEDVSNGATK